MYIIEQRLQAQNIPNDKSVKGNKIIFEKNQLCI